MGVLHKRGEKTKDLLRKTDMDEKQGEIISKGDLISESFILGLNLQKWVPNHKPKHHLPKKKDVQKI